MKRAFSTVLMTIMSSVLALNAQEFDLSTQRLESQLIPEVTGHKMNHNGMPLNPTPQKMELKGNGYFSPEDSFRLKGKAEEFSKDLDFIKTDKNGIQLTISYGEKIANKYNIKNVEGAYSLEISQKGISIAAYDETGAFYAIQTLRQISESGKIPFLTINDWPDLRRRGVVEGFYGTPWSHEVRLSLIDLYGRFKMNTYLYGPKDDPYHSCPNWRLPYPKEQAEKIKELVDASKRNRVDFVWAIHPGQDIKWNEEDYNNLLNKFEMMYNLGIRSFAIFFDDISGEGTNPVKQTELLNRLNREFVLAKGDVRPLIVCPTDYSKLWANPNPDGSLCIYGNKLDPGIDVFWTGDFVCSDLTPQTMEWINSRIKRPALYWWNFPVTDYVRHILMLGPAYGLDTTLTDKEVCGIVSNPMEHGTASRLGLYGVADYSWNIKAYNALDNWERAIEEEVPEAKEAYRRFAIHSCDTETGYRRSESWETKTFRIDNYTQEEYDALSDEFKKIENTFAELEENCKNEALMTEIRPWLVEFEKLGKRGIKTLELIKLLESGNYTEFWSNYIDNIMSAEELADYNAHKSGTLKLQPFYENAMDDMANDVYFRLTGKKSSFITGIGSFPNVYTTLNKLMFDNDSTTYYTSGMSQDNKSWTGADLGQIMPVSEIRILQGRNSVDDVDYYDHATLEYSTDGNQWHCLIENIEKQYIIHWKGDEIDARFIRLRKLESEKTNWAAIRSFEVNPITVENLGFEFNATDKIDALKAFDGNLQTFHNGQKLSIIIPEGVKSVTVLTGKPKVNLVICQSDKDGNVISESNVNTANLQTYEVSPQTHSLIFDGEADIYEIIMQ